MLLSRRPTYKLEDNALSDVLDSLFNVFASTLHLEDSSSIHKLRTRHAVVTGISHGFTKFKQQNLKLFWI